MGEELGRIEVENLISSKVSEILDGPDPSTGLVDFFSDVQRLDWFIDSDDRYSGRWGEET